MGDAVGKLLQGHSQFFPGAFNDPGICLMGDDIVDLRLVQAGQVHADAHFIFECPHRKPIDGFAIHYQFIGRWRRLRFIGGRIKLIFSVKG